MLCVLSSNKLSSYHNYYHHILSLKVASGQPVFIRVKLRQIMAWLCIAQNLLTKSGLAGLTQMMMENQSNKNIVAQFYKQVIGKRDTSLIYTLVREDYIQHSPAGKDGRGGLLEMVEFLKTLPPSTETQSPIKMLIEDGDMVAGLMDIKFMGKRMLVMDLFRLQDGMLAEHWDAVQEIDDDFKLGAIGVNEFSKTAVHKNLVAQMPEANFRRMIGEGDIVLTQSELLEDGKKFASYDIFKIKDVIAIKIVNIRQQIPDEMMHNNGMI